MKLIAKTLTRFKHAGTTGPGFRTLTAGAQIRFNLFNFPAAITNHNYFISAFYVRHTPVMFVIRNKFPDNRHKILPPLFFLSTHVTCMANTVPMIHVIQAIEQTPVG
jgi:hypothetical protein